ncbi:uncharacterized protein LOC108903495 [Anoplophora glabripennis]|uniref:uncharacterized protein LOC108903495 n=1 Tax=Anoplophora glabripennis TaxID=217634 RepID=UPI0008736531|nr:uncharacterized protein LOC108903495 [Anoplophora glabripennis]
MKNQSSSKSAKSKAPKVIMNGVTYLTKQVETSIALLDSSEDSVVLDALVYLSLYADIHENNLIYIQEHGLLQKLLNLLHRNANILRVTLKFLGMLLGIEEVMLELNQNTYDEKIIELSKVFISHHDSYVKECCVSMLAKLAASSRIVTLIFNLDLFAPILHIIEKTVDMDLLEHTLELLLRLVGALAAVVLPESFDFNVSVLVGLLNNEKKKIAHLSFQVIQKLTFYCLDMIQRLFRRVKLIEIMLDIVTDGNKQEYHDIAFDIIFNSMKSKETSDYFVETMEFLKFCQWVKTCPDKYVLPCILVLEKLTRIPSRRQLIFDFSVEESIISFLKYKDERVLNKTCEAISNMATHTYCCEEMLKPALLKKLFDILAKRDEEDTGNEVALKTVLDFNRLNLNTLDMIHKTAGHKVLLRYFQKGIGYISEESFLGILDILYKMSLCPQFQEDLVTSSFFEKLLNLFRTASASAAISACEILINFVHTPEMRCVFLLLDGPGIFMEKVRNPKDIKLMKTVLLFIHSSLVHDDVVEAFLRSKLIEVLKGLPAHLKEKMPLATKILLLIYKRHLPLKFFETHRLDITDKIQNMFYLINGQWQAPFPLFKDLEVSSISTAYVIYVVDCSYDLKYEYEYSGSGSISPGKISSERTVSTLSRVSSSLSSYFRRGPFHLNYGQLSPDPFLPTYICHVSKYLIQASTTRDKVKILAKYIEAMLCEPVEGYIKLEKVHHLKLHVEILKHKLGSNMIPIGYLRLGGLCERALIFKTIADKCCIPASLVKGTESFYWNEVLLFDSPPNNGKLKLYVVDLINNIGDLLVVGSRAANQYCNKPAWNG